jgi:hypothetical protein
VITCGSLALGTFLTGPRDLFNTPFGASPQEPTDRPVSPFRRIRVARPGKRRAPREIEMVAAPSSSPLFQMTRPRARQVRAARSRAPTHTPPAPRLSFRRLPGHACSSQHGSALFPLSDAGPVRASPELQVLVVMAAALFARPMRVATLPSPSSVRAAEVPFTHPARQPRRVRPPVLVVV